MEKEEYDKYFNPPFKHVTPKERKINLLKHLYPEKELKRLKSKQLGAILKKLDKR